jgi:acyl-CoA reductase-like NAD-dependent aldehyde dehydrogenase
MWHERQLLIDGERVDATGGAVFPTINPATEEVLGIAADAGPEDASAAVAAARRAFDTTDWSRDHAFRSHCLRQMHEALTFRIEEMRSITVAEAGAPILLTRGGPQLDAPVEMVRWHADLLDSYDWTEDLGVAESVYGSHRRWIEREAAGVVAAITPYNFPTQINLAKLVPALAAGCTVVLKGAPDTPWSALALGRLIAARTDIPAGVVNVLSSSGAAAGEALTSHPDVDMISFTGSTAVGRLVMAAAADTVKRVFLELGGKSAYVVLDDADVATVGLMAAAMVCTHAGQGCAITTRLVVPAAMHDAVVDAVGATLDGMPYGDPADESHLMGPLISERQRAKVEGLVATARSEGATVVRGGSRPEHLPRGFYYEPTVLVGVGEDDTIAQQEVFGPVLSVIAYDGGDDEAVRIANNSEFGLSGAVASADPERARAVARRIRTGTVSVNGGVYYGADAPFGGYKQSGIGREMGVAGFEEFLEIKTFAEPAG